MYQTISYHTINVQGVDIFYREAGAAGLPDLLLLHGFPSSSHMFRDLMNELSDRYHIIAPDYPGFGYSGCPSPVNFMYTFGHLAEIMEAFIDAIALQHFCLYIQDYGGPVGLRIAAKRPALIDALIIQNANAYREGLGPAGAAAVQTAHPSPELDAIIAGILSFDGIKVQYTEGAHNSNSISPDAYFSDYYFMMRTGSREIQSTLFKNYHTNFLQYPEWQQYFRQHQPPALIVWGKNDPIFTATGANAYLKDLPQAELHLLDGGHFILEEYHRHIAGIIDAFLAVYLIRSALPV